MFTFDSKVRYSEIDENKHLSLQNLLNYFQDCSVFHSHSLGRGMNALEDYHYAWVLSSWQVCINRLPQIGEEIQTSTWPYEFRGFYGGRNFQMKTKAGELLAYANSLWTFLDMEKGLPVKIIPEEASAYPLEPKMEMDYAPRKIALPKDLETVEQFTIKRHHLDTNHHVNNARYIQFAMNCIPKDVIIKQLRAEYKMQAMLGDTVISKVAYGDDKYTVVLCNEADKIYAIAEFLMEI